MKFIPIILTIVAVVFLSGCIQGFDATSIAKSSESVKAFLSEYPNAKVVASLASKADIREPCENQNLEIKDYWKVSIQDPDTGLTVNSWVDADTKQAVCVVKTGETKSKDKIEEPKIPENKTVEINETKENKPIKEPKEVVSPEAAIIANLTNNYEYYNNLDFSKVDCSKKEHFKVDLIDFSVEESTSKYSKTIEWYPSLNEGTIGSLEVKKLKNVGCTKAKLSYGVVVVFNGTIVSSRSPDELTVFTVNDGLYPNEESYSASVVIGENIFEPLKVKNAGEYVMYVYLINGNTKSLVGIDRIILGLGVPSPSRGKIPELKGIPEIDEESVFDIPEIAKEPPLSTPSPTATTTQTPSTSASPSPTATSTPISSPTPTPTTSPSPTTTPQPETSTVYDDFSSGSLDSSKWVVSGGTAYPTEYKVDASEGRYHTLNSEAKDTVVFLEMTRKINAGERVEFDLNYVSGSGNNIQYVKINGKGVQDILGCSNCGAVGFWNTVGSAGSSTGNYHFKFTFKSNKQVLMENDKGFSQTLTLTDSTPYTFTLTSGTGHNGLMHFDYDNFVIYINVE